MKEVTSNGIIAVMMDCRFCHEVQYAGICATVAVNEKKRCCYGFMNKKKDEAK